MTASASIVAKLILDATGYNKEVDKSKKKTTDLSKEGGAGLGSLGKAFESLTGISLGAAGAITVAFMAVHAIVKELKLQEAAANESNITTAKLNSVLRSTGYTAGMTAKDLNSMATAMSIASGIDDELITSAEAVLLTFTKLGKEVFPDTMQAAIDMSAVLGQDLQSSVTMIGKAMNDFSGYTALKRAGVSFTEEQIKQIEKFKEANDLIGYQNLLLQELQTEYGGAAAAINKASDGTEDLKNAHENYREAVGRSLPVMKRQWNEYWTEYYNRAAEAINATEDYKDQLSSLGITYQYAVEQGMSHYSNYMKDGVRLTQLQVNALIDLNKGWEAAGARLEAQAAAYQNLTPEIEAAAEEIIDYASAYNQASSYIQQFMNMSGKTAEQIEADTKRIILAMTEQQLAADGLSEDEMNYLITLGVQMGVYSQQAVDAYKKAEEAARAYANMIKSMPSQKTITIVTNYVSNHPTGYVPATGSTMGKAIGGQTVANSMYPVNESGKPELYTEGSKQYLLTGNQSGMVSQYYNNTETETKTPSYSGPSAEEIGRAAGAAVAVKLQQLGLV